MFLVGLTGGIAAGKSTVADLWQELGAEIIDADELAREVVQPGSLGLTEIVKLFGSDILQADGALDRKALAGKVFGNIKNRKALESITHPLIRDLASKKIASSIFPVVVYAIPLLVESKSDLPFDYVVTVEAPASDQIERMIEHRGMSKVEAAQRIAAQATPAERANVSDRILSSNQSLKLLLKDARIAWNDIELAAAEKAEQSVG